MDNDLLNNNGHTADINAVREDIYKIDAMKKIRMDMNLCMKIPT